MSKKRFKEGLESLFEESVATETFQRKNPLLKDSSKSTEKKSGKNSGKSFANQFDELFENQATEKIVEEVEKTKKRSIKQAKKQLPKAVEQEKQRLGIDALFRKTMESKKIEIPVPSGQKRVTFTFDQELLTKLKSIARVEKTYIREVIAEAVQQFIQSYEETDLQKGG